jgi:hypothetical protein
MKKVVNLIKPEKSFGGAWSSKRGGGLEIGALLEAEGRCCDLDRTA